LPLRWVAGDQGVACTISTAVSGENHSRPRIQLLPSSPNSPQSSRCAFTGRVWSVCPAPTRCLHCVGEPVSRGPMSSVNAPANSISGVVQPFAADALVTCPDRALPWRAALRHRIDLPRRRRRRCWLCLSLHKVEHCGQQSHGEKTKRLGHEVDLRSEGVEIRLEIVAGGPPSAAPNPAQSLEPRSLQTPRANRARSGQSGSGRRGAFKRHDMLVALGAGLQLEAAMVEWYHNLAVVVDLHIGPPLSAQ